MEKRFEGGMGALFPERVRGRAVVRGGSAAAGKTDTGIASIHGRGRERGLQEKNRDARGDSEESGVLRRMGEPRGIDGKRSEIKPPGGFCGGGQDSRVGPNEEEKR